MKKIIARPVISFYAFIALLLLAALHGRPALSLGGEPGDAGYEAFQQSVESDFIAGFRGDKAALDRAMGACEKALSAEPDHALALAWKGVGLTFQCGQHFESGDFQKGMQLWTQGLSTLDKAVELAPDEPLVRARRGETLIDVWQHDPMAGAQLARKGAEDMQRVGELDPDYFSRLPVDRRGEMLLKAGLAWEKAGDRKRARSSIERVDREASGSAAAKKAREWLAKAPDQQPRPAEASPDRFDLLVRDDFFAAMDGDRDRYQKAMKLCNETLKENPNHAGALAFRGWGLTIKSRWETEAGDKKTGRRLLSDGITEMNRAVDLEPDNVGPLLVRGSVFINATRAPNMSEEFRSLLLALGTYDYERVHELQTEQGYFKYLSEHARGELLMGLADAWHRRGNMKTANRYFKMITEEVPESGYAEDAQAVLNGKADLSKLKTRSCTGCHIATE